MTSGISFLEFLKEIFTALNLKVEQQEKLQRELEETIQTATLATLARDLPHDKRRAIAQDGKDKNPQERVGIVATAVGKFYSEDAIREIRDKTRDRLVAGFIDSMLSAAKPEQRVRVEQLLEKYSPENTGKA